MGKSPSILGFALDKISKIFEMEDGTNQFALFVVQTLEYCFLGNGFKII